MSLTRLKVFLSLSRSRSRQTKGERISQWPLKAMKNWTKKVSSQLQTKHKTSLSFLSMGYHPVVISNLQVKQAAVIMQITSLLSSIQSTKEDSLRSRRSCLSIFSMRRIDCSLSSARIHYQTMLSQLINHFQMILWGAQSSPQMRIVWFCMSQSTLCLILSPSKDFWKVLRWSKKEIELQCKTKKVNSIQQRHPWCSSRRPRSIDRETENISCRPIRIPTLPGCRACLTSRAAKALNLESSRDLTMWVPRQMTVISRILFLSAAKLFNCQWLINSQSN